MYETFFGLREKPFQPIPDPDFFYASRTHKMAFSLLNYGIADQAGFVVLTGDVGTGKTMLVRQLLRTVNNNLVLGLISNTLWPFGDLLKWILLAFDVQSAADDNAKRYQAFLDFLIGQYAAGKRTVLIIDEAQNLDAGTFEELRLLSNLNVDKHFLLQIVLAGQPELKQTLSRPELHRFVHRISVYYEIEALSLAETIGYIRFRVAASGGGPELFESTACAAIHHYAKGNPRLINVLADLALVFAFAGGKHAVDIETVLDAVRARQIGGFDLLRSDPPGHSREQIRDAIARMLAEHRLNAPAGASAKPSAAAPAPEPAPWSETEPEAKPRPALGSEDELYAQ